jgi:hypothetical protein
MTDQTSVLTERIAFAEEWLDRAKRHLADGDVTHGSLHVILAEAELQRARETSLALRPRASAASSASAASAAASRAAWPLVAACAVIAAGIVAAVLWHRSMPTASFDAPAVSWPIVTLSEQTGDMLRIVSMPAPALEPAVVERVVERTVVRPMIVRVTAPPAGARVVAPAPPAALAAAAPRAPAPAPLPAPQVASLPAPVPPAQPAVTAVAPTAPVLSDADVIDLVLAAERSLRQPPKH